MPISPTSKQPDQDAIALGFSSLAAAVPEMPRLADHVSKKGFAMGIQSYDEANAQFISNLLAFIAANYTAKSSS
jgi:hypothetical protein